MNELTPDVIAAIATRLYNEIPGMSHVPKSEAAVAELPRQAAELPGVPPPTAVPASLVPARRLASPCRRLVGHCAGSRRVARRQA